ncbi:acyl-coenzyme A synthetase ACSM3 [Aspergillus alliaceus]|uniref:medium-chain acyl-CoA ligase n=1 Tax=Petromyces alliaceus TaxID=209559 RepID=A0A5N7CAA3_PETAA|nr:acyl-coenzyme A synthetase ACSM3 [Aspergillus alliaceus]
MTVISRGRNNNPNHFNFIKDVMDYWSQEGGDPIAMVWNPPGSTKPDEILQLRFSHFSQRARDVAAGLRSHGIQKGDVLLLLSSKTPAWYEIFCGAILAGVVICPCPSLLVPSEIELRARKANASVLIGEDKQVHEFLRLRDQQDNPTVHTVIRINNATDRVECSPGALSYETLLKSTAHEHGTHTFDTESDDPCLMYFTSGTTGESKIVLHTHVSYPYAHTTTGKHWLNLCPSQLLWNMSEQGWAKATWALFGAWSQGAALFIDAYPGLFDPERVILNLSQHPITTFCAAPTIYRQLVSGESKRVFVAHEPLALEHCVSAGESLAPHVIREWYDMTDGLMIYDGFGQSETSILCGNYSTIQFRQGSMGKPFPGVPLYILNEKRQVAHPFEEGDIAIRVPKLTDPSTFLGLFKGYLQGDGSVVRPTVRDAEGQDWYLTGDRAHRDDEGYFWYKGRGDDIIISAGHRISPVDVESVLQAHPAILESAVIATPDDDRGATIKAFVVLQEENTTLPAAQLKQAIREHFLQRSTVHNCPHQIEFVDRAFLPKTVSGKIMRKQLRLLEVQ